MRSTYSVIISLIVLMVLLFQGAAPCSAYWEEQPVWGAWVSPDWFLPGNHKYNEFEVRQIVRKNLQDISDQGINHIFLETFLRGYSIAAVPDKLNGTLQVPEEGFLPAGQLPLYRHLNWPFRIENGNPVDTLQIFIDEAAPLGINVHAWIHMCYWKMDNRDVVLSWHSGMTIWNELLVNYFKEQKKFFDSRGGSQKTSALLKECIDLFSRTYDDAELEKLLSRYRVPANGKMLGSLLAYMGREGGTMPDFLLLGTPDDFFPAGKNRRLGAIYVNPANGKVQDRLVAAIDSITRSHPRLAGVHLDHIRYAIDYQGFPPELQQREWDTLYFNQYNDDSMKQFNRYNSIVRERREVITGLVNRIAGRLDKRFAVSAAVLPLNPPIPGEAVYFYAKHDYSGQDWYRWKVDFVVPMMYGYIPWRIRSMVKKWNNDMAYISGGQTPIKIFPGVSHLQKARSGFLDLDTWVFFDLTLARDVRFERKASDDFVLPRQE